MTLYEQFWPGQYKFKQEKIFEYIYKKNYDYDSILQDICSKNKEFFNFMKK
jgi:hypothetical protein